MFRVFLCHTVLSVPCRRVVTYWERADLLTLLCVKLSCDFVTFQYDVLSQMWYIIVLIPDLCLLLNFDHLGHFEIGFNKVFINFTMFSLNIFISLFQIYLQSINTYNNNLYDWNEGLELK